MRKEGTPIDSLCVCLVIAVACAFIIQTIVGSFCTRRSSSSFRISEERDRGKDRDRTAKVLSNSTDDENVSSMTARNNSGEATTKDDYDEIMSGYSKKNSNNNWRCACEGGLFTPGMLKSFGSAEAMIRLGTGECYHKQT